MAEEIDFESMTPEEIAEYQRQNCVFCRIVKGDIPSRKVYEDDKIISILDINPAAKGHLLILTKEHYPILPVIPVDVASHMFRATKQLAKALKEGVLANKTTVFIANGAIAGQQSPHFLYHIIPRENNDGLDNFNIPSKEVNEAEIASLLPSLKGRIGLMMKQFKARKNASEKPAISQSANQDSELPLSSMKEVSQRDLAELIQSNPQMKQMIIEDPESFKKELEANPQLKSLFSGINIDKLSEALKRIKT